MKTSLNTPSVAQTRKELRNMGFNTNRFEEDVARAVDLLFHGAIMDALRYQTDCEMTVTKNTGEIALAEYVGRIIAGEIAEHGIGEDA